MQEFVSESQEHLQNIELGFWCWERVRRIAETKFQYFGAFSHLQKAVPGAESHTPSITGA